MSNFEYLITRPGIFKLFTIIFGVVSFVLASFSYADSPYTEFYGNQTRLGIGSNVPGTELELYHLTVVGTFVGLSIAYLVLYAFIYELCESSINRIVDTAYHMCGALFLFAGACVHFYSAVEIQGSGCTMFKAAWMGPTPRNDILAASNGFFCHHFGEKIVGAAFTLFNGVLYCITGFIVFTTKDL